MRLAEPWFLLLLLVPTGLGWRRWRHRRLAPEQRLAFPTLSFLVGAPSTRRMRWRLLPDFLGTAGLTLLIVALARPQSVGEVQDVHSRARNIMIALDISSSMKAGDFQPGNRLTVARRVVSEFVRRRTGDLLGLVIFSGRAFLQAPLNADTDLLGKLIDQVDIGMLPDGTAIGTALALCIGQLKDLPPKASVVILITDGANNTGEPTPLAAAEAARALGIRVHAVGLSTEDTSSTIKGPYIWHQGREADHLTASDEAILRRITARTSGHYYRATDPELFQKIMDDIDPIERTDVRISELHDYRELYAFLLGPGLLLLGLQVVLSTTWLRSLP